MAHPQPSEMFVRLLTEWQSRLNAYIMVLLGDPNAVDDVLQETNVTLWRKANEFVMGTNFGAWARKIAYFEVMAYRKRRGQERLVFDDELLKNVAEEAVRQTDAVAAEIIFLRGCVEKLSRNDQELIRQRYVLRESVKNLAEMQGKSAGAISLSLYRIRDELADCIEEAMKDSSKDQPKDQS